MAPPTATCLNRNQTASSGPVPRDPDHLDHHQHEHHRDRVVESRLPLERQRHRSRQAHPAQQREHRRAVGRRQDRAEQQPSRRGEVQQPAGRDAGNRRAPHGADRGERDRRPEHRPERAEPSRKAALEQNEHERDRPHQARQRVVREIDPTEPVAAHGHAKRQEQNQRGQAQACGHGRGDHAGGEQTPAGEDQLCVADHGRTMADRRSGYRGPCAVGGLTAGLHDHARSCTNRQDRVLCRPC